MLTVHSANSRAPPADTRSGQPTSQADPRQPKGLTPHNRKKAGKAQQHRHRKQPHTENTNRELGNPHVNSRKIPRRKMSTRRYPHMEKGYISTRRRKKSEPEKGQQKADIHAEARQEYIKEKEKALDLIEAYPEEMLLLMEQLDRGEVTEEELSEEMDKWTEKLENQRRQHQNHTAYSCAATVDRIIDKVANRQETSHGGAEDQTADDTDEETYEDDEEQQDSDSQSDSSWTEEEKTIFAQAMRYRDSNIETEPREAVTQTKDEENNNVILPDANISVIPTTGTVDRDTIYLTHDLDDETYDAMANMFEENTHKSNPDTTDHHDVPDDDGDEGENGKMPSLERDAHVRAAAATPHVPPAIGWVMGGETASAAHDDKTSQSGTRSNTEHRRNKDVNPGRNVCSGVAGSFPYHLNHVSEEEDKHTYDTANTHDARSESLLHDTEKPPEANKGPLDQAPPKRPRASRCTCVSVPLQMQKLIRWGRRKIEAMVAASLFVAVNSDNQASRPASDPGTYATNSYVTTQINKKLWSKSYSAEQTHKSRAPPTSPAKYRLSKSLCPQPKQTHPGRPTTPGAGVDQPQHTQTVATKMAPTAHTMLSVTLALVAISIIYSRVKNKTRDRIQQTNPTPKTQNQSVTPKNHNDRANSQLPNPAWLPPIALAQQERTGEASTSTLLKVAIQ